MLTLEYKLKRYDRFKWAAFDALEDYITLNIGLIVDKARTRHIDGHYIYGDSELENWPKERCENEMLEEIADALVYMVKIKSLEADESGNGVPDQGAQATA
jgi:hypothetical protein